MTRLSNLTLVALFLFSIGNLSAQSLIINELQSSNGNTIADDFEEFDDWIEIYNPSNTAIDMAGLFLTDDLNTPEKWLIPATNASATTVPAGGFLLFWLDGTPEQGEAHTSMKLSSGGEQIGIFNGSDFLDSLTFGELLEDQSWGRTTDGGSSWATFFTPTPNETNNNGAGGLLAADPVFDIKGGMFDAPIEVAMTTTTTDAIIRFTIDGSTPNENSAAYTGPITIIDQTSLRAKTFAPGYTASNTTTGTYFFGLSHDNFYISAVTFDDDLFYGPEGLYTLPEEDVEVRVSLEIFTPEGERLFGQDVETEIHGTSSALIPQKSLAIKAKSEFGDKWMRAAVFPQVNEDKYGSLILRNSGNDWNISMFRDALVTGLVEDLSDLDGMIKKADLDMQAFLPGIAYFNGQYMGIHNIRERMDKRYLELHYGLNDDEVDVIDGEINVREGDLEAWTDLTGFLNNNSFQDDATFAQLSQMMDTKHFIDYNILNIIADNVDWPGNNNRRFRERADDAQWRWLTYDFDFSWGLYDLQTNTYNTGIFHQNSLERLFNDEGFAWPTPVWGTLWFRKCQENTTWRHQFINRMADQMNVIFEPTRVNERITAYETLYEPEIQAHLDLWNESWNEWAENLEKLRLFTDNRLPVVRQHVVQQFAEITNIGQITTSANPLNGGRININTVRLKPEHFPWTGTYFAGIDIPVSAHPEPGFIFQSWSGAASGNASETSININGNTSLIANFIQGSTAMDNIIINEINYNSQNDMDSGDWVELFNPNNTAVDISGWYFKGAGDDYFPIPANTIIPAAGYTVLVENEATFTAFYPNAGQVIGSFGEGQTSFKLSNDGEEITLYNASNTSIDNVTYNDAAPWVQTPDGEGNTLQLIDTNEDNNDAFNWCAGLPSPGEANNECMEVDVDEITTNLQALYLAPNPAKNETIVHFNIAKNANITLTLVNTFGQKIQHQTQRYMAGEQNIALNISDLPRGTYFVTLQMEQQAIVVRKLVKMD